MAQRYEDLSPNVVILVLSLGIVGPVAIGALWPQATPAPAPPAAQQAAPAPSASAAAR